MTLRELLEVVTEKLTNGVLWELEYEHIAEEEMEIEGGEREGPLRKFTVKCFAESFADPRKIFKKFKNMDLHNKRIVLIEQNVPDELSVYKEIYDEKEKKNKPSKLSWTYSRRGWDTSFRM